MDDDDAARSRLERNFALLERFASAWQRCAAAATPGLPAFVADAPPLDITPPDLRAGAGTGVARCVVRTGSDPRVSREGRR